MMGYTYKEEPFISLDSVRQVSASKETDEMITDNGDPTK